MGYPQLVTQISENGARITTIVDAPWVSVTSVNGMTGDVEVELLLQDFQPNHFYKKNTAVLHSGSLYYAKADFNSGSAFNGNDWYSPSFEQEQADYAEDDPTEKSYIKHKPASLTDIDSSYVPYSMQEKTKLAGIEAQAQVNVQPDWNEGDNTSDAYIANKPNIPSKTSDLTNDSDFTTKAYVDAGLDDAAYISNATPATIASSVTQLQDRQGNNIFPIAGQVTDNTISTSMLQNSAVTDPKIAYTKTIAEHSSYLYLGDILIQWGQISGVFIEDRTFTMPQSFANTDYTLTLTNQYPENNASFWWAFIKSKAVSSFVARGGYKAQSDSGGSGNSSNILNWIAIGQKA